MIDTVSILIKALNEERRIDKCLTSVIKATTGYNVDIILVDSLSSDRTIEIAQRYPVKIVQFKNKEDIGCGSAVQLAYQHAKGGYLYVLDADMEMVPGFISEAIKILERRPDIAGVGGRTIDVSLRNSEDFRRQAYYSALQEPCTVISLGGGGLYRRAAIESVGYLADRWLQAGEELDLGLRLRSAGWELVRIPQDSVIHEGHEETSYALVQRIYRSGRMSAYGIILRRSINGNYVVPALRNTWFILAAPLLYTTAAVAALALWSCGVLSVPEAIGTAAVGVMGLTLLLLAVKKVSLKEAAIGLVAWHLFAISGLPEFLRPLRDPLARIDSIKIVRKAVP